MNPQKADSSNVHALRPSIDNNDDLTAIRNLLLGPQYEKEIAIDARLSDIQNHLDHLDQRTADLSPVLASSIRSLHDKDKHLNSELEPEITSGLYKCFNTQPDRMADALYPILGPAVRKLVASLFQGSATDQGKPYQVEQLFLIHKETSVVLSQSLLSSDAASDADLVSGMLDAIRGFVQEAFALSEYDGMNCIKLGDLTIWVEWGPKAILAVVVRGIPDNSVPDHYAEVLRLIHKRYETELAGFDGDISAFSSLELSRIESDASPEPGVQNRGKPLLTANRLVLATLVSMFVIATTVSANRSWQRMLTILENEPGIVVIKEEREWLSSSLSILRDPLAASRQVILDKAKINSDDTAVSWYSFQSQDSDIAARRNNVNSSANSLQFMNGGDSLDVTDSARNEL